MSFQPDWTSPLRSSIDFYAELKGLDANTIINKCALENISTESTISFEQARALESTLGGTAQFWIDRCQTANSQINRVRNAVSSEELAWLRNFPYSFIASHSKSAGHDRSRGEKLKAILRYFNVSDITEFRHIYSKYTDAIAFRKSGAYQHSDYSTLTWIREAMIQCEESNVSSFDPLRIDEIIGSIKQISRISDPIDFVPKLRGILGSCGIKLAIVPTPPKCAVSGAVFIYNETPHINLSFRYKNDAQFWFTLFHELGHCRLHTNNPLFLEGVEAAFIEEEKEADDFAVRCLYSEVPTERLIEIASLKKWIQRVYGIKRLSRSAGIPAGLIVARMQHLGIIQYNELNKLKVFYKWDQISSL